MITLTESPPESAEAYEPWGEQYVSDPQAGAGLTRRVYLAREPGLCAACGRPIRPRQMVTLRVPTGGSGLVPVCTACVPVYGRAA